MHACSVVLVAAALGVNSGWQPLEDGGMEYIVQIQPDLIDSLRNGEVLTSVIPVGVESVRSFKIVVGNERPPRIDPPVARIDRQEAGALGSGERANVLRANSLSTSDERPVAASSAENGPPMDSLLAQANSNLAPRVDDRYLLPQNVAPLSNNTWVPGTSSPGTNSVLVTPGPNNALPGTYYSNNPNTGAATTPFRVDQPMPANQPAYSNQPLLTNQRLLNNQQPSTNQQPYNNQPAPTNQQTINNDPRYALPANNGRAPVEVPTMPPNYRSTPPALERETALQSSPTFDSRYNQGAPQIDNTNRSTVTQSDRLMDPSSAAPEMLLRDVEPLRTQASNTAFRETSSGDIPRLGAGANTIQMHDIPAASIPAGPAASGVNDANSNMQGKQSQDVGIGSYLVMGLLLLGSLVGNFYLGYTWLAIRRRFHSLLRDRRLAM